jgi:hypothetical protein
MVGPVVLVMALVMATVQALTRAWVQAVMATVQAVMAMVRMVRMGGIGVLPVALTHPQQLYPLRVRLRPILLRQPLRRPTKKKVSQQ